MGEGGVDKYIWEDGEGRDICGRRGSGERVEVRGR